MDSVMIMLIANAGILVEYQGQQLLIDALHEGHRLFPATPPEALQALLAGQSPFRTVKAIVITHNHLDHFSATMSLSVLQRLASTSFIADEASAQALIQADRESPDRIGKDRILVMPWQLPRAEDHVSGNYGRILPSRIETGPFSIQPVPFEHEGERHAQVANVGLLITVGGLNILYPGDARMQAENFAILQRNLPPVDIAVVMFPYISTSRGQNLVRTVIRPRSLVVVHWPDPDRDNDRFREHAHRYFERNRETFMPTVFLERYQESVRFDSLPSPQAPSPAEPALRQDPQ